MTFGIAHTTSNSFTVYAEQSPGILVTVSTTSGNYSSPGTALGYDYDVDNTGNVTLSAIGVTDSIVPSVSCPDSQLAPGISETCTGSYSTTQGDVDTGSVTDSAVASGTPPSGPAVDSASNSFTIYADQSSGISVDVSTTSGNYSSPGTALGYDYDVDNTGNVTLSAIGVIDSIVASVSCPDSQLAPGASETCTGTYSTTQADVDAGSVTDSAVASGTPPSGPALMSSPSSAPVLATQVPAIQLTITTNLAYFVRSSHVLYSFSASNVGNVTLTAVGVTDSTPGLSAVDCPSSSLAVGTSETCTANYRTTIADVNAGSVTTTASAVGTPPVGAPVGDGSSDTLPGSLRVFSVSPDTGPTAGGTVITIDGVGFSEGDTVFIGQGYGLSKDALPAVVTSVSADSLVATTSGGAKAGKFHVFVVSPSQTRRAPVAYNFDYTAFNGCIVLAGSAMRPATAASAARATTAAGTPAAHGYRLSRRSISAC